MWDTVTPANQWGYVPLASLNEVIFVSLVEISHSTSVSEPSLFVADPSLIEASVASSLSSTPTTVGLEFMDMTSRARKSCRTAGANNIIRLVWTLHKKTNPTFQCSSTFCNQPFDPDYAQPLDKVEWDCKTKRYHMKKQASFGWDDAVLQAMCMLFIVARVQQGWKQVETCAQLTIWP